MLTYLHRHNSNQHFLFLFFLLTGHLKSRSNQCGVNKNPSKCRTENGSNNEGQYLDIFFRTHYDSSPSANTKMSSFQLSNHKQMPQRKQYLLQHFLKYVHISELPKGICTHLKQMQQISSAFFLKNNVRMPLACVGVR